MHCAPLYSLQQHEKFQDVVLLLVGTNPNLLEQSLCSRFVLLPITPGINGRTWFNCQVQREGAQIWFSTFDQELKWKTSHWPAVILFRNMEPSDINAVSGRSESKQRSIQHSNLSLGEQTHITTWQQLAAQGLPDPKLFYLVGLD